MENKLVRSDFIRQMSERLQSFADRYDQRNEKIADLVRRGEVDAAKELAALCPNVETMKALQKSLNAIFEETDIENR